MTNISRVTNSEKDIFEIEPQEQNIKDNVILKPKKEKVKLSQERVEKLKLQLITAREAKQKKKNIELGIEEPKHEIKQEIKQEPKQEIKQEVVKEVVKKERKPRVKKEDKTEFILQELLGIKSQINNIKNIPVKVESPKVESIKQPPIIQQPIIKQQPIIQQPYSLFKIASW
jgi:hypothetical protein